MCSSKQAGFPQKPIAADERKWNKIPGGLLYLLCKCDVMTKTVIILLLTIVVLPIVAFQFDAPLTTEQLQMLKTSATIMLGVALACFVVAELTKNCSQTDKLWSLVPMVYGWYFAYAGLWQPRLVLMAVLITVWGVRLTYNFSRRGAYRLKFWEGEEDYRWEVLRKKPEFQGRLKWMLFNLFFISLYQHLLILLFTLPAIVAWQGKDKPLYWADYLLAAFFVGLVFIEWLADQQQWNFQTEKYRKKNTGEKLNAEEERGFLSSGLWSKVRHPNYAAEQVIWIVFYFFSVAATGRWINWSLAGCMLLLILFQGSSNFSEEISASKYPAYKDYQKRVGRFLPKLF